MPPDVPGGVHRIEVINRLREAGFHHALDAKRVSLWRNGSKIVHLTHRKRLAKTEVIAILMHAGLTLSQIDAFLLAVS